MNGTENRLVSANGREIRYCLERKDVKNLNLRVLKDGRVFVSANSTVPTVTTASRKRIERSGMRWSKTSPMAVSISGNASDLTVLQAAAA